MKKIIKPFGVFLFIFLSACQSALKPDGYAHDPYESFNRFNYQINETLDDYLLQPIAKTYETITPNFVQTGVRNFFGNIQDSSSLVNSLLQFKWKQSAEISARIINNTVFGLGGLFDVATEWGNHKINADFGQTLAHYGVESGPYLMLPFIGPTTPRDAFGKWVDWKINPRVSLKNKPRFVLGAINSVQQRSELLGKEGLLKDSPDPYSTLRDAWLQRRWAELGQSPDVDALLDASE